MRHTSGLSITLAAIWVLSGCAILEPRAKEGAPTKVNVSEFSEGYALLYDLVSKEKQSSLLSIIKTMSKVTHLPRIEQAARDSIDKETSKEPLQSKGVDLEFHMLSSQLPAMNYAAHLARSLAVVETNPRRKEFLQRTDRTFSDLHGQVYKMLFTHYQR